MDAPLTVKLFCERYDICRPRFYELVRSGQLEALKLGKKTIVTAEQERAFLANLPRLFADPPPAGCSVKSKRLPAAA